MFTPPTPAFLSNHGRVASLGMFIIDQFQVSNAVLDEKAIGGGGIFAMVAARMFLPPSHCALVVDRGDDFPDCFTKQLETYGDMVWFRSRQGKTTRALNIYSGDKIGDGHQSFEYLSPQLHLSPRDLLPPSPFARPYPPEWVHVVCVTERAKAIYEEMETLWRGKLIWEPLGRTCTPSNLDAILDILPHFAAFSPNLLEMQSILASNLDADAAATHFHALLTDRHPNHHTAIIVRAGASGSYTLSSTWRGWVPAYFADQAQVVDVTGGGNAWLGGLCAGLLVSDGDFKTASIYASTAASFAIQQRGLPRLENNLWNGEDPWTRLGRMQDRLHASA